MERLDIEQKLLKSSMTQHYNKGKIDLEWSDDGVVPDTVHPDLEFLFQQMLCLTLEEVDARSGELILDVGCGKAIDAVSLSKKGAIVIGLEPSKVMIDRAKEHLSKSDTKVALTQGVGENLPFKSCSFNKVMCKGALDHFLSPSKTMEEISRVLKSEGEAIIAIANFESLGFRLGKKLYRMAKCFSRPINEERKPWELPPDHTYKFDYQSLSSLVRKHFEIKKTKGISLFFGLPLWGDILSELPHPVSYAILKMLDKLTRPFPSLADVIVMKCIPSCEHK